jgi:hypothetical protein
VAAEAVAGDVDRGEAGGYGSGAQPQVGVGQPGRVTEDNAVGGTADGGSIRRQVAGTVAYDDVGGPIGLALSGRILGRRGALPEVVEVDDLPDGDSIDGYQRGVGKKVGQVIRRCGTSNG